MAEILSVKLDPEEKRALRVRAAEEGTNMSEYVRQVLRNDLDSEASA